jgi:hypothetical protein
VPYNLSLFRIYSIMEIAMLDHDQIEAVILHLDPTARDCRLKIADVRLHMDESCDHGVITIRQWRRLLDMVSDRLAKCHR